MSHFARIDENNVVVEVIVAERDYIDSGVVGPISRWIQTSYNTFAGEHALGGTPLRKNYAGIGYTYDRERDAFIPPKPFDSWILNESTCQWESPTPFPQDGKEYIWEEALQEWKEPL